MIGIGEHFYWALTNADNIFTEECFLGNYSSANYSQVTDELDKKYIL